MGDWLGLSRLFPWQRRKSYEAKHRLTEAYVNVFRGSPSRADQEIVLADLAALSGFSLVSGFDTSDEELRMREGMRMLYAHIESHLSLSAGDREALREAARNEVAQSQLTP